MRKPCKAKGCERPSHAKGYCNAHYLRLLAGTDIDAPLRKRAPNNLYSECIVESCDRTPFGHGLCVMHYTRKRNGIPLDAPVRRKAARVPERELKDRPTPVRLDERGLRMQAWLSRPVAMTKRFDVL